MDTFEEKEPGELGNAAAPDEGSAASSESGAADQAGSAIEAAATADPAATLDAERMTPGAPAAALTPQQEAQVRRRAVRGSAIFLLLAPGIVTVAIPWWVTRWEMWPPFFGWRPIWFVGGFTVTLGAIVLLDCFARFALQGLGTPAPVYPTRRLVVSGLYRYVRNPMYLGAAAVILGQALFFSSATLLEYCAAVWAAAYLFVLAYEEPTLRARYGAAYEAYCRHVRRWWPRLSAWQGGAPEH